MSMKPIYGTTMAGTEAIIDLWLAGHHHKAINELMLHISVNKPGTIHNTPEGAKNHIMRWIKYNLE